MIEPSVIEFLIGAYCLLSVSMGLIKSGFDIDDLYTSWTSIIERICMPFIILIANIVFYLFAPIYFLYCVFYWIFTGKVIKKWF